MNQPTRFHPHFIQLFLLPVLIAFLNACSHSPDTSRAKVETYNIKNTPTLGKSPWGQEIKMGGFSGLLYQGKDANGQWRFLTIPDRGPNAKRLKGTRHRPFVLPDFHLRLISLAADPKTKTFEVVEEVPLRRKKGKLITGLPNKSDDELPVNLKGKVLQNDFLGMDLEGLAPAAAGGYWIVEEYRPSISHFDAQGVLQKRLIPKSSPPLKQSVYGVEELPQELATRQLNRGFEGVSAFEGKVFAIMQSPLQQDRGKKAARKSRNVRLVEIDESTQRVTGMYLYILEHHKADKMGDLYPLAENQFLTLERDSKDTADSFKFVYHFDISKATNLLNLDQELRKNLDFYSPQELQSRGIQPVKKTAVLDLAAVGIRSDKLEGLAVIDKNTIAIINDNDFGLAGPIDTSTGQLELSGEVSQLYLITLPRSLNDF